MLFYIYWEGSKNKDNFNIVEDPTVTTFDPQFFQDVAYELGKEITPDTKFFSIPQRTQDDT